MFPTNIDVEEKYCNIITEKDNLIIRLLIDRTVALFSEDVIIFIWFFKYGVIIPLKK